MLTFQKLICACASMWHVTFNHFKSKSLILSRKVNKPYHPPIYMNFQQVNSHKNLGIYLSRDCTLHEHIKHITSKAWQRIHIMHRLKFILDRKSLQTIYFPFIRTPSRYADVFRDNCSKDESQRTRKNQNKAARIVTDATK